MNHRKFLWGAHVFINSSIITQFEFRFKQTHCAHAILRLFPQSEQHGVFEKLCCKCKELANPTRGNDFRRLFQLETDQIFSLELFVCRDEAELMSYTHRVMERRVWMKGRALIFCLLSFSDWFMDVFLLIQRWGSLGRWQMLWKNTLFKCVTLSNSVRECAVASFRRLWLVYCFKM